MRQIRPGTINVYRFQSRPPPSSDQPVHPSVVPLFDVDSLAATGRFRRYSEGWTYGDRSSNCPWI